MAVNETGIMNHNTDKGLPDVSATPFIMKYVMNAAIGMSCPTNHAVFNFALYPTLANLKFPVAMITYAIKTGYPIVAIKTTAY